MRSLQAWRFLHDSGNLNDSDDSLTTYTTPAPPDGAPVTYGDVVSLNVGEFYVNEHALDALRNGDGAVVCCVRCVGKVTKHRWRSNALVCDGFTIRWRADASEVLRAFARWCALTVIAEWSAPPSIVREYLEGGDESKREFAWEAASAVVDSNSEFTMGRSAWNAAKAAVWASRGSYVLGAASGAADCAEKAASRHETAIRAADAGWGAKIVRAAWDVWDAANVPRFSPSSARSARELNARPTSAAWLAQNSKLNEMLYTLAQRKG